MTEEQKNQQQQPEAQQQQDNAKAATSPAGAENADKSPQQETVSYARFKEINDKLKALEDKSAQQAKEQESENEKKLAEQAQWQQLADARKAKVEEMTPKVELADKLSAMVLEQYTAEIAAWPEQVKAMAPGDDADVLTKLDWLKRAKPLATELMADSTPPAGNGRRPPPVSPAGQGKADETRRKEWTNRAVQRYR